MDYVVTTRDCERHHYQADSFNEAAQKAKDDGITPVMITIGKELMECVEE
mgnify:CR=1 FL=1